jgi:hypothetical protein
MTPPKMKMKRILQDLWMNLIIPRIEEGAAENQRKMPKGKRVSKG